MDVELTKALKGAQVRDVQSGMSGEVENVTSTSLTVDWHDPDQITAVRRVYSRSDNRLFTDFEVNLLDRGWIPFGEVVASPELRAKREKLLQQALEAKGDHNPFQHDKSIGPGPRGRKVQQTKRYKCKRVADYKQSCLDRDTGRTRVIKVDKGWKSRYTKAWWKHTKKNRRSKKNTKSD